MKPVSALNKLQAIDHTSEWNALMSRVKLWSILMLFPWFPNSTYKTILPDRPRHLANGNWTKPHLEAISTSHGSAARDLISNDPMHFLCFPPHRQICWLHHSDSFGVRVHLSGNLISNQRVPKYYLPLKCMFPFSNRIYVRGIRMASVDSRLCENSDRS